MVEAVRFDVKCCLSCYEYPFSLVQFFEPQFSEQPYGIKRAHAYALIQAMKIRPLLPEIPRGAESTTWTEYTIRPLLHKDFTPADQKRIGKKRLLSTSFD